MSGLMTDNELSYRNPVSKFDILKSKVMRDSVMEPGFVDGLMNYNQDMGYANLPNTIGNRLRTMFVDPVRSAFGTANKAWKGEQLTLQDNVNTLEFLADYGIPTSLGAGLMSKGNSNIINSIPAWHGSPHRIKGGKFLDRAIGTGEGAQAFGYGHYFTDKKSVAEGYAKELSGTTRKFYLNGDKFKPESPDTVEAIRNAFIFSDGSKKDVINFIKSARKDAVVTKSIDRDLEKIGRGTVSIEGENLYKTTLHKGKTPDEYSYLEWDKPLPKEKRNKLLPIVKDMPGYTVVETKKGKNISEDTTGRQLYEELSRHLGSDKEASKILKGAGIDGVKYPAGSLSGGNKDNAFNYVVFDPEDITVDEHYINGLMQ